MGTVAIIHYFDRTSASYFTTYYFIFCDKCGSWDIMITEDPNPEIKESDSGLGDVFTCLFYIMCLVFPPLWIVVILSPFIELPSFKETKKVKYPIYTCIKCGTSWQRIDLDTKPHDINSKNKPPIPGTARAVHRVNGHPYEDTSQRLAFGPTYFEIYSEIKK